MKSSSWDTNIRAEAEIEVVRCTIQERGDSSAWKQGEKEKRNRGPWSHFFPHFSTKAFKAHDLSYLTAKETTKASQTYIFPFFVSEVLSKEGEGNYFYLRHLFYLKPLFKCWFDLLSVAGESTKLKKKMGMQYWSKAGTARQYNHDPSK